MIMNLNNRISMLMLASALLVGRADAFAQSIREFSYADEALMEWGTGLLEKYDIAVRIAGNGLDGKEILGFSLPISGAEGISDVNLWMSSELVLEGKVNHPNISSFPIELKDGKAEIMLDEPFTVPKEGVYLGCSFAVSNLTAETKMPLTVSKGYNDDSFFVHTSRKYTKWGNYDLGLALDLKVTLQGEFYESSMEVTNAKEGNVLAGEVWTPEISVRNLGLSECTSFDYTLTIDDAESIKGSVNLEEPLKPSYSLNSVISLNPLASPKAGKHVWSITVNEVNGLTNQEINRTVNGELYVWPYLPTHRPLMEEYTGTWCGWCPRGAVGLSKMQEKYSDDFVAIVYHTDPSNDPMATAVEPTTKYDGAPWGVLDRTLDADPFFGFNHNCSTFQEGIEVAWLMSREEPTPVSLVGEASWADDSHEVINVTADAVFVRDFNNKDIRLGYFLVADGLKGETAEWFQSNYYSGLEQYSEGDLRTLYELPRKLVDYKFDHVLVYTPDAFGSAGSLPSDITWLDEYSHSIEIPLELAVNASGTSLVQDKSDLHVVIAVIDADNNRVFNSKILEISESSASNVSSLEKGIITTRYYDLQGRLLNGYEGNEVEAIRTFSLKNEQPVILVEIYEDGSATSRVIKLN